MKTESVGTLEAKTRLSEILQDVQAGASRMMVPRADSGIGSATSLSSSLIADPQKLSLLAAQHPVAHDVAGHVVHPAPPPRATGAPVGP